MKQLRLKGLGVSPGIALGKIFILESAEDAPVRIQLAEAEIEDEVARFLAALARSREQVQVLRDRVSREVGQEHAYVFDAQLLMLQDDLLIGPTVGKIKNDRVNVEWALQEVREALETMFRGMDDAYFADRGSDIGDIIHRVQLNLGQQQIESMEELQENIVMVARDLNPSQAVQMEKARVLGFAIDTSSRTSHAIILARSLKIPAVIGLHDFYFKVREGDVVLVDGTEGEVVLNPSPALVREYLNKKQKYDDYQRELLRCSQLPSVSLDGVKVTLQANVESLADIPFARQCGADGVGLFRTEYLILAADNHNPDEETQCEIYRAVLKGVQPHSAIIRTADLGGDKLGDTSVHVHESNPILGLRAVRLCLRHRDFFKQQLRALLRAGLEGNLRILIPMVSGVTEIRMVRQLLAECAEELTTRKVPYATSVPLGAMIEVPAAVTVADLLAREVDFFSIGTNDLIQHTLAVDRDNDAVSYLYEPLHPAILRSLRHVLHSAAVAQVPVSLCGEAAAEPLFALIMLGLGLREFSMNPAFVPVIKRVIRVVRVNELEAVATEALRRPTAQDVEEFVLEKILTKFPEAIMMMPGGIAGGLPATGTTGPGLTERST